MRKPPDSFNPVAVTFKSIFEKTALSLVPDLKQELSVLSEDLLSEFRTFPRSNQEYRSVIKILTETSKIHTQGVLSFLKDLFVTTIHLRGNKTVPLEHYILPEYDPNNPNHVLFIRYYEYIFMTDLITSIFVSNPIITEFKHLQDLGYLLCSISISEPVMYEMVLPQFAYIIHTISKVNFDQFYDSFSQLIINKPEPYFILVKYVHLVDENPKSYDFLEIIYDYMNHQIRRKTATNLMLESVSTLLLKFIAHNQIINKFERLAQLSLKIETLKYGALELISTIMANNRVSFSDKLQFYTREVVPLLQEETGFNIVVRIFYILSFGSYINSNQFLSFWVPETSDFEFVPIEITDSIRKEIIEMSKQFLDTIFPHEDFSQVQSIIRNTLLYFACADFDVFINEIADKFLSCDDERFTTFLSCVGPINNNIIHICPEMIIKFNNILSQITYRKLNSYLHSDMVSRFFSSKLFEKTQNDKISKNNIFEIMSKWDVDTGPISEIMRRSDSFQINGNIVLPSSHLIETLPYILTSNSIQPTMWTSMLVKLSAINNSSIANPASVILLKHIDDQKDKTKICENLVAMITIKETPEIVFVCLNLLLHAAKACDPSQDRAQNDVYSQMEYVSFLCLASEYPFMRSISYQLLIVLNKLKSNEGFYSHIEKHIQAIESNVKHNILLQQLPKRPENHKYYVEEISLETALNSPYQHIWNYFLSEFSRIVAFIKYLPITEKISDVPKIFLESKKNHLTLGLLVIFFSMSIVKKNFNKEFYVYETKLLTDTPVSLDMNILKTILERIYTRETISLAIAVKHTNYTLVPFVLSTLKSIALKNNPIIAMTMDIIYNLLKSIEGINNLRVETYEDANYILESAEKNFKLLKPSSVQNKEHLILYYLLCMQFWILSNKTTISINAKNRSLAFILDNFKEDHRFICYAASTLVSLLETGEGFGQLPENTIRSLLKILIICEEHNYDVLVPLLDKDFNVFIEYYIEYCYTGSQSTSDFFFNAISEVIDQGNGSNKEENHKKILSNPYPIIVIGLYKLKTGYSLADSFLRNYLMKYANEKMESVIQQLNTDNENKMPIIDIILKYMPKHGEAIVHTALSILQKFINSCSVKVFVDIMMPFVCNFRILPYQHSCMNIPPHLSRMSPYQFLCLLFDVTSHVKPQDFEHLTEVWSLLMKEEESRAIVLPFLFEMKNPEVQIELFTELLQENPKEIINSLLKRLEFSFYAYCSYQGERKYDDEMWIIQVIIKAIQYKEVSRNPIVLHHALLFHSSHTLQLLKKLCKQNKIAYSRRALSDNSLALIVESYSNSFKSMGEMKLIETWALEAMRWVIGSKSLKIASTSLVILNHIDYTPNKENSTAFFHGIFRSVAYFLGNCTELDQYTSKFINDTFVYFNRFFSGNEKLAFDYIKCFFEFVVIVDAYFDQMIPLYAQCRESNVTKDDAEQYLLLAIRPIFNELESDNKAKYLFKHILRANGHIIDVRLVGALLKPFDECCRLLKEIERDIDVPDFNRLLGHLSFMSLTASADLMTKIFVAANIILKKYAVIRGDSKNNKPIPLMPISSLTDLLQPEKRTQPVDILSPDIDKRALHILYKVALSKVMSMHESIDLILCISSIEPLISTTNFVEDRDFVAEANGVIQNLNNLGKRVNEVVSFTECQDLESTSNLLNPESHPKVQPFTSEHEVLELISKENSKVIPLSPDRKFFKMVAKLTDVYTQLKDAVKAKLNADGLYIEREFKPLIPPQEILEDLDFEYLPMNFDPLFTIEGFCRPEKRQQPSRQNSVRYEF